MNPQGWEIEKCPPPHFIFRVLNLKVGFLANVKVHFYNDVLSGNLKLFWSDHNDDYCTCLSGQNEDIPRTTVTCMQFVTEFLGDVLLGLYNLLTMLCINVRVVWTFE